MKEFLIFLSVEIKLFLRQKVNLVYIVLLPLLLLLFFGFIFNNPITTMKIHIDDRDNSELSRKLIHMFKKNQLYQIVEKKESNVSVIIVIPENFEKSLSKDMNVNIDFYINSNNEQTIKADTGIINSIQPAVNNTILGYESKINFNYIYTSNIVYSYTEFLIPGLILMVILSLGLYNIGLKLTVYRQYNQLKIYYTFSINEITFLFVHIILNLIIVITQTILILLTAVLVFNAKLPHNLGLFVWSIFFSSIAFLSFGFLLSSFFRNYITAMSVINILYFPLLLLSGIYFTLDVFPEIVRFVKYISPAWYCVDFVRSSYLGLHNTISLIVNNSALGVITFICIIISLKKFKWHST